MAKSGTKDTKLEQEGRNIFKLKALTEEREGKTSNSREIAINSSKIPVILHGIDATCMEKQPALLDSK